MKILFSIAGILILVGGLVAGFFGNYGVLFVAFFGFIACLITANLDRISEFKAQKVELKLRHARSSPGPRVHFTNFSSWQRESQSFHFLW